MKERAIEAGREVMRACIDGGGSLTGEHGIGVEKQMYNALGLHRTGHGCDEAAGGGLLPRCGLQPRQDLY